MDLFTLNNIPAPNQQIQHEDLERKQITLFIKREDQIDADVSGNKYRKLKYNVLEAKEKGYDTLLTFGGAFSNHIAATAAAGAISGLRTIGIIRGEELGANIQKTLSQNDTLRFAAEKGMEFKFVSRKQYRDKTISKFIQGLHKEFGSFYYIPEGGTNTLAIKGCEEILMPSDSNFDVICCPVGTGGTISGIINTTLDGQKVLGFLALRDDSVYNIIKEYTAKTNWDLTQEYCFGGYAKVNEELITFINAFKKEQHITLDPIYTGKMIYGIFDMVRKDVFPKNTRILAVHTGGLQGIAGINKKLIKKKLPLITI